MPAQQHRRSGAVLHRQIRGRTDRVLDNHNNEFRCAGVSIRRHIIQREASFCLSTTTPPFSVYVVQGRGTYGVLTSGCAETFESGHNNNFPQEERSQRFRDDKHQKVEEFQKGDVIAIRAGDAHWSFFLAGNPGNEQEEEQYRRLHGSKRGQEAQSELGQRLQCPTAAAKNKHVNTTASRIPSAAPESRRISTEHHVPTSTTHAPEDSPPSTASNLPILSFLQLSASRGVLHRNAIFSPHWYTNAHTLIYATHGASRVQIVNHRGQAVFDGQVREGQVLVVPQNFAVIKQASEQGFEWVAFSTNENAAINTLSGRTSAIRGLPVDVVANAYQVSREEAQRIKFSRQETLIFNAPLSASA
ncbi:hypothetical protein SASPL_137736 [Salvia splendens]|uniref:Cupin type-1 domain-containing protein n=1 Tax=Salvia splendens TaxID=180675 RepID=A0A8X8WVS2_SALSN|nr:hypothetical protein SASPL_137736 [Salvia splendens]